MRIQIVSPFFNPVIGGVESVLDTTCEALAKSGHKVQVLTSSIGSETPREETRNGVTIIRSDLLRVPPNGVIKADDFRYSQVSTLFKNLVDEFDPSVVHFHNYQMRFYAMFLLAFLNSLNRKRHPVVNTIHNDADDIFSQYVLTYFPLDRIVTVTKRISLELMEAGVPADRVAHVPNMVDSERYRAADRKTVRRMLGVEEDSPIILYPSRLVGREGNLILDAMRGKGLDLLMRALPEVLDWIPDAKVLLLGNDNVFTNEVERSKRRLKKMAEKMGAKDSLLFFKRFVPNEMLPSVFAASDIVVSLSSREAFGMVFIEGMAAGKPVVGATSNINGVAEVVPDELAGLLVPENDSHATARAITKILLDEKLKAEMGLNGIKWVKKKFDTRVVLPKLIATYQSVANQISDRHERIESLEIPPQTPLNEEKD
ncbi:MAG TPA: glycosyltransferase family 4 protein [Nitrososphaerales archaeon]|nr:glycosyltransferase family 4 protein [Nitrososphaerales archaeon]